MDGDEDGDFGKLIKSIGWLVGVIAAVVTIYAYFKPPTIEPPTRGEREQVAVQSPLVVEPPAPEPSPEDRLWEITRQADTVEAYNVYLDRFPSGIYVGVAQSRIVGIGKSEKQEQLANACRAYYEQHPVKDPKQGGNLGKAVLGVLACTSAASYRGGCKITIGSDKKTSDGGAEAAREQEAARQRQEQAIDACILSGNGPPSAD